MKNSESATPIASVLAGDESKELFAKGKDFLEMYNRVTEFTKELVAQNEELKQRLEELTQEREKILSGGAGESEQHLLKRLEYLRRERQEILDRYHQKEEENKDFFDRFMEIETENNNLANLYVASYQLHSTLDFLEVLDIITEIIINLIGAQTFGIWLLDEKKNLLEPVTAEGVPLPNLPPMVVGEGIIGSVAQAGEVWYRENWNRQEPLQLDQPLVCVPLKIKDRVIGVIVVFRLLPQKERLVKVDFDLFTLLAAHAATAIFGARLYSDSVRKRTTIKGFLDLLTH
jgi:hypothetical protein